MAIWKLEKSLQKNCFQQQSAAKPLRQQAKTGKCLSRLNLSLYFKYLLFFAADFFQAVMDKILEDLAAHFIVFELVKRGSCRT